MNYRKKKPDSGCLDLWVNYRMCQVLQVFDRILHGESLVFLDFFTLEFFGRFSGVFRNVTVKFTWNFTAIDPTI